MKDDVDTKIRLSICPPIIDCLEKTELSPRKILPVRRMRVLGKAAGTIVWLPTSYSIV